MCEIALSQLIFFNHFIARDIEALLSVHLLFYLSICLSTHLSIPLSVYLSSIYYLYAIYLLSICYLSTIYLLSTIYYLYIYYISTTTIYLHIYYLSIYFISAYLSIRLTILSIYISVGLSDSFYPPIDPSILSDYPTSIYPSIIYWSILTFICHHPPVYHLPPVICILDTPLEITFLC